MRLDSLLESTRFRCGNIEGTLLYKNECRCRVRIHGGKKKVTIGEREFLADIGRESDWAPSAEVEVVESLPHGRAAATVWHHSPPDLICVAVPEPDAPLAAVGSQRHQASLTVHHDEASWLAARRLGIGSSDGPEILGRGYRGPLSVYADKVADSPRQEPTWAMRCGHAMEAAIAEEFSRETGLSLMDCGDYGLVSSGEIAWLAATPDRLVRREDWVSPPGLLSAAKAVLEIKTVNHFQRARWQDEPSELALIQVQHQLLVLGLDEWHIAASIGHDAPVRYQGERNEKFLAVYVVVLQEFWDRVQTRCPPDNIDGSEATREALVRLYPKDRGLTISLPPEFVALDARREVLREQLKAAEEEKDIIDNQLRAAMGDAAYGTLPGVEYSLKTEDRKAYSVKASTRRPLKRKEL
jgi:predicted phage-related endonuclease